MEAEEKGTVYGTSPGTELPAHHLRPGTVLNRKFEVGGAIGEGGFGVTYSGRDLTLDMKVAIKEYYPNGYVNRNNTVSPAVNCSVTEGRRQFFEKGRESFLNEARALAKFSGEPGIVNVRDFFEENNTAYIVMEFLEGETLGAYLKKRGRLEPEETVSLLMPVMQSLKKVHSQGLIHRDISPDNIMLAEGRAKLLDFGAARSVSADSEKSLSVMLKPGYAPEEQYRSKGNQGPWTDVYAICATMYRCITGIIPEDSVQRSYSDGLKSPSALGISVSHALEDALMKGLSVLKEDRYQNMDELLEGLGGMPVKSDPERVTIYMNPGLTEDEIATTYLAPEEEPDGAVYAAEHTSPPSAAAGKTSETGKMPEAKPEKEAAQEPAAGEKPAGKGGKAEVQGKGKKVGEQAKKRRKIGIIAAVAGASVLLWAVIIFRFIAPAAAGSSTVPVAGKEFRADENSVSLSNVSITAEDVENLASLEKLQYLYFRNCSFDKDAAAYLGSLSASLVTLDFSGCTGIEDYSAVSGLQSLKNLAIQGCGLTDRQLGAIIFGGNITSVKLNGNEELADISALKTASGLLQLQVDGTAVTDFKALETCSGLRTLSASGNGIQDISSLASLGIVYLTLSGNQIADLTPLAGNDTINELDLCGNRIRDISALAGMTQLRVLKLNDNMLTSLAPLSGCTKLTALRVNRNELTDLRGLEQILELKEIDAAGNQISDIGGLQNCTVLRRVNLTGNAIEDISLLQKSAATLNQVYLGGNKIDSISALKGTAVLEYLNLDNNGITTLEPLSESQALIALSAEYNRLTSTDGLGNAPKLRYLYLAHNQIENVQALAALTAQAENNYAVIDLSHNAIRGLQLNDSKSYERLVVYDNPLASLDFLKSIKGIRVCFDYLEEVGEEGFTAAFSYFDVLDCPPDRQVATKSAIRGTVRFVTAEEAEEKTQSTKTALIIGE